MSAFADRVYEIVKHIPKGQTMTYKEVARRAGSPGAARAVGALMARNYDPEIPCHRVIRTDGTLGDYNRGGPEAKKRLLAQEAAEA